MRFNLYRFTCRYPLLTKTGIILESEGIWSEVSPWPGKNHETTADALEQLKAVQSGWKGQLFPSVEWGLYGLQRLTPCRLPAALLLMGSPDAIIAEAETAGFTVAKIKIGDFDVLTARDLVISLKDRFRLRIDLQEKWSQENVRQFCSYFQPADFECIEDPGCTIDPFPTVTEAQEVWKPMVRGVPPENSNVYLSSVFESGIGIAQIGAAAMRNQLCHHPLGVGTYRLLQDDILKTPLVLQAGYLEVPATIDVDTSRLQLC